MNYEEAIDFFETLDDDNKAKEIYAFFGNAIYFSQVVEQQAINMLAIYKQVTNKLTTKEQVESLWDNYDYGTRTLGVLINEIKQQYELTDEDFLELKKYLKLRNYITHDYYRHNIELFYSESGKKE